MSRLPIAKVQAVVETNGRARPVRLDYRRYAPTLPEVIFDVLQAGTPPEVSGLGTTVRRRIVWTLPEGTR